MDTLNRHEKEEMLRKAAKFTPEDWYQRHGFKDMYIEDKLKELEKKASANGGMIDFKEVKDFLKRVT